MLCGAGRVVALSLCLSRLLSICIRVSVLHVVGVKLSLLPASLFRALVDSPGLHTGTKDCTLRAVRAVCRRQWVREHRQETGEVSRCSHMQQSIDMANYRIGSCTALLRPSPCLSESLLFAPCSLWCSYCVPTVPWLCDVSLLLPSMLMVLLFFQMITVHTFASGSNAKMFGISATTLFVVWTSAACALMFCPHREKKE